MKKRRVANVTLIFQEMLSHIDNSDDSFEGLLASAGLCVCVCVCVNAMCLDKHHPFTCQHITIHTHSYTHTHIHTHTNTHTHTYTHTHTHTNTHTHKHTQTHTHIHIHTHSCIPADTYTHTHTFPPAHLYHALTCYANARHYQCKCVCIHTHVCIRVCECYKFLFAQIPQKKTSCTSAGPCASLALSPASFARVLGLSSVGSRLEAAGCARFRWPAHTRTHTYTYTRTR